MILNQRPNYNKHKMQSVACLYLAPIVSLSSRSLFKSFTSLLRTEMIPKLLFIRRIELKFCYNVLQRINSLSTGGRSIFIPLKRKNERKMVNSLFPPGYHLFTDEEIGISESILRKWLFPFKFICWANEDWAGNDYLIYI